MSRPLLAVAGVLALATVVLYGWMFAASGDGLRPPDELAREALTATDPAVRERAALDLSRSGAKARGQMLRVVAESPIPEVRVAAIQGLETLRDFASGDTLFALLDDPSDKVRAAAGSALTRILGADFRYRATDPADKRQRAVKAMRAYYGKMKANPPPSSKKGPP